MFGPHADRGLKMRPALRGYQMADTDDGDGGERSEAEGDGDDRTYDVIVIGGGPAGLSTALYTTRLGHNTAVLDRGGGRAAMMADTHNVLGVTEDVSGKEFLDISTDQIRDYGGDFRRERVTNVERRDDDRFEVTTDDSTYAAKRVVIGTGFNDERPDPPLPRTGRGLHYCLHCDAYTFVEESVYVMGHGNSAAHVAMIMLNFTGDVDLLTRGAEPTWSEDTGQLLDAHPVDVIDEELDGMWKQDDGWLGGFEFADGTSREYKGGFAMYGSDFNTELAEGLGCDLTESGAIEVDDHGNTSVDGVYAVGDVTPGHNQIPVAVGEGAKAGIDIHMNIRTYPKSLDEIEADGPVDDAEVPGISPELREAARAFRPSDD